MISALSGADKTTQRADEAALAGDKVTARDIQELNFTSKNTQQNREATINKALSLTQKKSLNVTGLSRAGKQKDQTAKDPGAGDQNANAAGGAPSQGPKIWNIDYALIRFIDELGPEGEEQAGSNRANRNKNILRKYGHGKAVEVVDQEAMRVLFERTKSDKIWSRIDCVQTNIRA